MTVDPGAIEYAYAETWDGLYAPIALLRPDGPGPHPVVVLASGNGGGGVAWLRDAVLRRRYIMDRLAAAGYASVWTRYRAEVELGYDRGGPLIRDTRQGRDLFSRSPLEYEDAIAIIEHLKAVDGLDGDRVGMIGMSHGGEMVLKLTTEYHGLAAAVASEPAAHEFLALIPDETAHIKKETGLRDIEEMQMAEVEKVRARIDLQLAATRIASIRTPILVMGRDNDHLQGIFRVSYELLAEAGKASEWVSWDHPLHGYVYPITRPDGTLEIDEIQEQAIESVVGFFDRHMGPHSA